MSSSPTQLPIDLLTKLPPNLVNNKEFTDKLFFDVVSQAKKKARAIKLVGKPNLAFRGNQEVIQNCTDEELGLSGPAGTGKSVACLYKLHLAALNYPKMRGLIVRKTRESLTETGLFTFEERILGDNNPLKEGPQRNNRQVYRYPNGSKIVVGGLDKPTKIMSSEYDLIFVQEATETDEEDHEALLTRLRNGKMPYQQLLLDFNPDKPTHWIKQRANAKALTMLETQHEDNPTLYDDIKMEWTPAGIAYMKILDKLTGVRKERLRHGRWVAAEGMILDEWNRKVHIIKRFPIPLDWTVIAGVDWGFTKPGVIEVIAFDGDGRGYLIHEVYKVQKTISWWVAKAKFLKQKYGIECFYCDPSEPDKIADFNSAHLNAVGADNSWNAGTQEVQERLVVQDDGKARFYVFEDALEEQDRLILDTKQPCGFIQETEGFVWKKNSNGFMDRPADNVPDHAQDGVRYAFYSSKTQGARSLSSESIKSRPDVNLEED